MIILEFNSEICHNKVHIRYRDSNHSEWSSMIIDPDTLTLLIQHLGISSTTVNDQIHSHVPLLYYGVPVAIPVQRRIIPSESQRQAVTLLSFK